ncbi:MAG: DUF309 domain-containing protein [Verrucomicrobia bacterium]|nr:DUF309 domain-containing protein [Verrucomicrobiota bacterium]
MSQKSAKRTSLIAGCRSESGNAQRHAEDFDPCYTGYFEQFNRRMYFEAHETLEASWRQSRGARHLFYKGLIQLAGAFVHLQKSRLHPASRLFRRALIHLDPYQPEMEGLDVSALMRRIREWLAEVEGSDFTRNPFDPEHPPRLELHPSSHSDEEE